MGIAVGDSVKILIPEEYEGITGVVADIREPEAGDWMTLHIEFDRPMRSGLDNEYFMPSEVEKWKPSPTS